jgi:hypothetical protein
MICPCGTGWDGLFYFIEAFLNVPRPNSSIPRRPSGTWDPLFAMRVKQNSLPIPMPLLVILYDHSYFSGLATLEGCP